MADWREISRVRKNVAEARSIAARLLKFHLADFTEWEVHFLEAIARYARDEALSTRQAEKLLQIRDDLIDITEYRGFSVKILLRGCYEARLDLSETDEQWIVERYKRSETTIKRKHIGRLMHCARELHLIEEEEAA